MSVETFRFVIPFPDLDLRDADVVLFERDWERLTSIVGTQYTPFIVVECRCDFSSSGRLKHVDIYVNGEEYGADPKMRKELYLRLFECAKKMSKLVETAFSVAPESIDINVSTAWDRIDIYVNNALALRISKSASYRSVKIYELPENLAREVEVLLMKRGFSRGKYGGLITRSSVDVDQLAEELKSLLQASIDDLKKMFRERIVRARNTLLWVDDWDPEKTLEDDIAEKLMRAETRKEETEEAEIVEETATSMEEIGRRILEDVEGVELEPIETPAVSREVEEPRKPELVKVYLLKMRLPSKYLVQRVRIEKDGEGFREIRDFSEREVAAVASRLEGVRRAAYEMIARHFVYVDGYGMWIAVSEDAVRKAEEVGRWVAEELKALGIDADRYFVKAIPVYLEVAEARELLSEAVRLLESEKRELEERVREAEAEKKRSALRKLEKRLAYKQALLEAFRKYLASLG